jgi:hypothetical protein
MSLELKIKRNKLSQIKLLKMLTVKQLKYFGKKRMLYELINLSINRLYSSFLSNLRKTAKNSLINKVSFILSI